MVANTGRPSLKTPERVETILRALRDGCSKETATHYAGIARKTLLAWEHADEGLADRVREARSNIVQKAWSRMTRLIDSNSEDVQFKASKYVLDRLGAAKMDELLEAQEESVDLAERARAAWDDMRQTIPLEAASGRKRPDQGESA